MHGWRRSGTRATVTGVAALSVAVLVLAGCSSSSKSTTSSSASAGSSVAAPTGSPIVIGVIGSLTGAQASSSNQAATVAPAWADYVNKQLGGINGHPVQVIVKDDQGQPTAASSAITSLIGQHIVALLAGSDNLLPAFSGLTVTANIPVVSGTANATDWYTKPMMFPTVTDTLSGLTGQIQVAKQFGKATKFANLYCAEIAACAQAGPPLKAAAAKLGVGYTELAISSTATSYTAQCLALKQQGVDYAQLNFTTSAAAKLVSDCQAQGYNPTFGTSAQSIGADYLKLKDFTAYGPAYAFPSVGQVARGHDVYQRHDQVREGRQLEGRDGVLCLDRTRRHPDGVGEGVAQCHGDGGGCCQRAGWIQQRDAGRLGREQAELHRKQTGRLRWSAVLLRDRGQGWEDDGPEPDDTRLPDRLNRAVKSVRPAD